MTPSRSKIARSRRGARRATVEDEGSAVAWLDGEGALAARACAVDHDRRAHVMELDGEGVSDGINKREAVVDNDLGLGWTGGPPRFDIVIGSQIVTQYRTKAKPNVQVAKCAIW